MIAVVGNYDDDYIVKHIVQNYIIKNISMRDLTQPHDKNSLFHETYIPESAQSKEESNMERKAFYLKRNVEKYGKLVVSNCSNKDDIDLIHKFGGVVIKFVSKKYMVNKDFVLPDEYCDHIINADTYRVGDLDKIMKSMGIIKVHRPFKCERNACLFSLKITLLCLFFIITDKFARYMT